MPIIIRNFLDSSIIKDIVQLKLNSARIQESTFGEKMAENQSCGALMGFLLVALPIFALIFGSDEPAMQTDNAAFVMTGMIVVGIIMMVNSSNKRKAQSATPVMTQRRDIRTTSVGHTVVPQSSSRMIHGSTPEREVITRILVVCPYCGSKNEQGILRCQNCSAEL